MTIFQRNFIYAVASGLNYPKKKYAAETLAINDEDTFNEDRAFQPFNLFKVDGNFIHTNINLRSIDILFNINKLKENELYDAIKYIHMLHHIAVFTVNKWTVLGIPFKNMGSLDYTGIYQNSDDFACAFIRVQEYVARFKSYYSFVD
jgi:hypothetical protein